MISLRYGSLFDIDVRDSYVRRIARIWPLLLTTVLIGMSLVYNLSSMKFPADSVQAVSISPL